MRTVDVGHGKRLAHVGAHGSRGGEADLLIADEDVLMLADDAAPGDLEADAHLVGLAFGGKGVAADEVVVELDGEGEPGAHRRDVVGQLVAVQRHGRFQAQRVARAETAGNQALLGAGFAQLAPQRRAVLGGRVQLVSARSGVAGAGNHAVDAVDVDVRDGGVVAGRQGFGVGELREDLRGGRPLQRQLSDGVGDVLDLGVRQQILLHVGEVLFAVRRVDDHEVRLLAELVDDQIVDGAAVFMAHDAVAHAPGLHVGEIVCEQVIQAGKRTGAGEEHLAHMRDVEQPAGVAHGVMLGDHARILNGQQIAGEGDDLAAFLDMHVVQGCFLLHGILHSNDAHRYLVISCASVIGLKDSPRRCFANCFFGARSCVSRVSSGIGSFA